MCYHNMDIYIWILPLCVILTFVHAQTCKNDPRCRVSRIHAMKGADCYNKDMRTLSQCLPSDVEIIDLSRNRIRKLKKEDLEKYSDLKMLYLSDNLIVTIDEETFQEKAYLQTLDLQLNALTKLPPVLFHLPSLQSLYLGHNLNMNIVEVVEKSKPITSPLYHLDISYVMSEESSELPDLGLMPYLKKYNISGNKLMSMTAKYFAGLCSLELLDTTNVSIEYEEDHCHCWIINRWLKSRRVIFKRFECTVDESECPDGGPTDEDLEIYTKCKEEVEENLRKSKLKTVLLIVIPVAVALLAVLIYCCVIRKRRRQRRTVREQESPEIVRLNNELPLKTAQ